MMTMEDAWKEYHTTFHSKLTEAELNDIHQAYYAGLAVMLLTLTISEERFDRDIFNTYRVALAEEVGLVVQKASYEPH